jgi:predicted dehydrogenase
MPCRITFRVVALSDIDPKRLHAVSEQFSIPRATVRFELLPMPDPDIIDICTHPSVPWTGQHPDR